MGRRDHAGTGEWVGSWFDETLSISGKGVLALYSELLSIIAGN